jgi:hypothetical protein
MFQLAQAFSAYFSSLTVSLRYNLQSARRDDRGDVTVQTVLWALAAVVFVGMVVGAITLYLNNQIAKLR